jgi:hypothetical protein
LHTGRKTLNLGFSRRNGKAAEFDTKVPGDVTSHLEILSERAILERMAETMALNGGRKVDGL